MRYLILILTGLLFLMSFITGFLCNEIPFYLLALIFTCLFLLLVFRKQKIKLKLFIYIPIVILLFYAGLFLKIKQPLVCAPGELKTGQEYWKDIKHLNLDSISRELSKFDSIFGIDTLTLSAYQNDTFPIHILRRNLSAPQKHKLLIIAGIHGSEPAGVFAIPKIVEIIKDNRKFDVLDIHIIYALNPVGLNLFTRFNECNCDINRDFKRFNTKQAQALKTLFDSEKYDFVLDFHEGPFSGQFVMTNSRDNVLKNNVVESLKNDGIAVSPKVSGIKGFFYQYQFNNFLSKHGETVSILSYCESMDVNCFVSESDVQLNNMDDRVKGHIIVFNAIADYMTAK